MGLLNKPTSWLGKAEKREELEDKATDMSSSWWERDEAAKAAGIGNIFDRGQATIFGCKPNGRS